MPRRVLVTGASGLIGSHVVEVLSAGNLDVHAVSRSKPPRGTATATWHAADLLAPDAGKLLLQAVRPDLVIHLAWETRHGHFWTAPENTAWAHASVALMEGAARLGVRRFVGVGTCAEYADTEDDCDEFATPICPTTPYGRAKAAVFEQGNRLSQTGALEFAWGRVFMLYGPGEDPRRLVPSIVNQILDNGTAKLSSGLVVRDFLHSRDVSAAIATVAQSSVQGAVNVGSGAAISVADLARKIAVSMGRPNALQVGALPDRSDEPKRLVARIGRLNHEAGYLPKLDLDSGLAETITWWQLKRRD